MCLNLTPAPWKSARTRDRGPVHSGALIYENRADICSAMLSDAEGANGSCYYSFTGISVSHTVWLGFVFGTNTE